MQRDIDCVAQTGYVRVRAWEIGATAPPTVDALVPLVYATSVSADGTDSFALAGSGCSDDDRVEMVIHATGVTDGTAGIEFPFTTVVLPVAQGEYQIYSAEASN